ncbi:MAG: DUF4907 domain-containing protein [Bacteroidota bacterium]
MIKKNWIYLLFALSVALFAYSRLNKTGNHAGEVKVSVKTFQSAGGWGYDIYTNDSVYIHQENIPALEGHEGFATKEDAEKIGNLAMSKMKHSKLPVITLQELDSCGISK